MCTSGGWEQPAGKQLCREGPGGPGGQQGHQEPTAPHGSRGAHHHPGLHEQEHSQPSSLCSLCSVLDYQPHSHELVWHTYLHHPSDATLCVAVPFRFRQVRSLLGLGYFLTHPGRQ